MKKINILLTFVIMILIAVSFSSCDKDNDNILTTTEEKEEDIPYNNFYLDNVSQLTTESFESNFIKISNNNILYFYVHCAPVENKSSISYTLRIDFPNKKISDIKKGDIYTTNDFKIYWFGYFQDFYITTWTEYDWNATEGNITIKRITSNGIVTALFNNIKATKKSNSSEQHTFNGYVSFMIKE